MLRKDFYYNFLKVKRAILTFCFVFFTGLVSAGNFCWPVDGQNVNVRQNILDFIQPTVSGNVLSGTFGLVRNNGHKFHSGIDIKSTEKGRNGQPADNVLAFYDGRIVYVNYDASQSSFGCYIIIEHVRDGVTFYSLYAHLSRINEGVIAGELVRSGDRIAIIGRTSSVTSIPKSRAHLHFEIGLKLADMQHFQSWYDETYANDDKNFHGEWNGMNFARLDPIDFFQKCAYSGFNVAHYIQSLETACSIVIATSDVPCFLRANRALCQDLQKVFDKSYRLCGWAIDFSWNGVPKSWKPVFGKLHGNDIEVLSVKKSEKNRLEKFGMLCFRGDVICPGKFLKKELAFFF